MLFILFNLIIFYRPVQTLGTSLVTIRGAYPRRGCATETMTVLIILTKINKIAPHPLAHPQISDAQLAAAFQIPSDVMETTIVETVLVSKLFYDLLIKLVKRQHSTVF